MIGEDRTGLWRGVCVRAPGLLSLSTWRAQPCPELFGLHLGWLCTALSRTAFTLTPTWDCSRLLTTDSHPHRGITGPDSERSGNLPEATQLWQHRAGTGHGMV